MTMRFAVISDIHGNIEALDAVLSDISKRETPLTLNLGDVLSGPLCPAECADRLIPLRLPTIRGNHEQQLQTMRFEEMGLSEKGTFEYPSSYAVTGMNSEIATLVCAGHDSGRSNRIVKLQPLLETPPPRVLV
jgi:predicted phosphodiesterase